MFLVNAIVLDCVGNKTDLMLSLQCGKHISTNTSRDHVMCMSMKRWDAWLSCETWIVQFRWVFTKIWHCECEVSKHWNSFVAHCTIELKANFTPPTARFTLSTCKRGWPSMSSWTKTYILGGLDPQDHWWHPFSFSSKRRMVLSNQSRTTGSWMRVQSKTTIPCHWYRTSSTSWRGPESFPSWMFTGDTTMYE